MPPAANAAPIVPMALITPAMIGSAITRPASAPPTTTMLVVSAWLFCAKLAMPSARGVITSASRVSGGSSAWPTAMPSRWLAFWKLASVPLKV